MSTVRVNFYPYFSCTDTEVEKERVEVLQHDSDRRRKTRKQKIEVMNFSTLVWYMLPRLILRLILVVFKKSIARKELELSHKKLWFPICILAAFSSYSKNRLFCVDKVFQ